MKHRHIQQIQTPHFRCCHTHTQTHTHTQVVVVVVIVVVVVVVVVPVPVVVDWHWLAGLYEVGMCWHGGCAVCVCVCVVDVSGTRPIKEWAVDATGAGTRPIKGPTKGWLTSVASVTSSAVPGVPHRHAHIV